jgi:hypothetical protein
MESVITPAPDIWVPSRHRIHEPVRIVFNGSGTNVTNLTSPEGPAIFDRRSGDNDRHTGGNNRVGPTGNSENVDGVLIVLQDNSTTTLRDTRGVAYPIIERVDVYGEPDNIVPNATVFIRNNLTIRGRGELNVFGHFRHGISTRDDLIINGGTFLIETGGSAAPNVGGPTPMEDEDGNTIMVNTNEEGNALLGRDSVTITAGVFRLRAGNSGVRANNILTLRSTTTASQRFNRQFDSGFINITGGRFREIYAPNGSAFRAMVPETGHNGAGGGMRIASVRLGNDFNHIPVQFDHIVDRQGAVDSEEGDVW